MYCRIATERETGKPRGFCFVDFFDIATAESAVRNLNGSELGSRPIRVIFSDSGPSQARPPRREGESLNERHASMPAF
jgi:cleavage stimulation factor subunit 2